MVDDEQKIVTTWAVKNWYIQIKITVCTAHPLTDGSK